MRFRQRGACRVKLEFQEKGNKEEARREKGVIGRKYRAVGETYFVSHILVML